MIGRSRAQISAFSVPQYIKSCPWPSHHASFWRLAIWSMDGINHHSSIHSWSAKIGWIHQNLRWLSSGRRVSLDASIGIKTIWLWNKSEAFTVYNIVSVTEIDLHVQWYDDWCTIEWMRMIIIMCSVLKHLSLDLFQRYLAQLTLLWTMQSHNLSNSPGTWQMSCLLSILMHTSTGNQAFFSTSAYLYFLIQCCLLLRQCFYDKTVR